MTDAYDRMGTQLAERARLLAAEHGPFASAHEAYGVLAEELQVEFFAEVCAKDHARSDVRLRDEALDIAAAALRYAVQLEAGRAGVGTCSCGHGHNDHGSDGRCVWRSADETSWCVCMAFHKAAPTTDGGPVCELCDGTGEVLPGGRCWRCGGTGDGKPEPMAKTSKKPATADDVPLVGDVWVGEDSEGAPIERVVSRVLVPSSGCDWQVELDGRMAHRGWWHGQGWTEKER